MSERDLDAVAAISDAVHKRFTESRAVYAGRLALYPAGCFVFEMAGRPGGYLIGHPWLSERVPSLGERLAAIPPGADTFYLHDIALLPALRGQGAGRSGLQLVESLARRAGFGDITLMAVGGADRFWQACGFEPVGNGPSAGYGQDSVKMRLKLAAPA